MRSLPKLLIPLLDSCENNTRGLLYSLCLVLKSRRMILYGATYWVGKIKQKKKQGAWETRKRK